MVIGKCTKFVCCYKEKGICKIYKKECFKCPNGFLDNCEECLNEDACNSEVGDIEFIEEQ